MLVGGLRLGQLAGLEVDVVVALARAVDAVGPVQAGVEPLRRVRRAHLRGQHVAVLVEEGLGVGLAVEIAALPAPVGPGAGQAVEHLLGRHLADNAFLLGQFGERGFVTDRAPQPGRHGLFLGLLQARGHAGLAEILLRQHVRRHLRPGFRHLHVFGAKHHRAIRVADFARGQAERDVRVGRLAVLGEAPFNFHSFSCPLVARRRFRAPTFYLRTGPQPQPFSVFLTRPLHSYGHPKPAPARPLETRPFSANRRNEAPLRQD